MDAFPTEMEEKKKKRSVCPSGSSSITDGQLRKQMH